MIRWGRSGPPYENVTTAAAQASNTREHAWFLSGLKPETTYHYAVCSTASAVEVCSEDQTFVTTAKGSTTPIAPAEVDVCRPWGARSCL